MRSSASSFEAWNRKLHFYLGLYFLFFLWLFALTGLMLNHQQWFRDLYQRREISYQNPIVMPASASRAAQTLDFMQQLELRGEPDWPAAQPAGHLDFNVARPNGAAQVRIDFNAKLAHVKEFENSRLHAFQSFHTFSGSRFNQPASHRDWAVTTAWVIAMDALSAGLVVMVAGSYYMWWRLKKRRTLGVAVLTAGIVCCGLFVSGVL